MVERPNGMKEWCLNNKLHRLDVPAIERADGHMEWYQNGVLHRVDRQQLSALMEQWNGM